jgi:hypothetical protein
MVRYRGQELTDSHNAVAFPPQTINKIPGRVLAICYFLNISDARNLVRSRADVTFTAETHNFPSGVAPFPGAETGTGGRIRDGHATGTGSLVRCLHSHTRTFTHACVTLRPCIGADHDSIC